MGFIRSASTGYLTDRLDGVSHARYNMGWRRVAPTVMLVQIYAWKRQHDIGMYSMSQSCLSTHPKFAMTVVRPNLAVKAALALTKLLRTLITILGFTFGHGEGEGRPALSYPA